MQESEWRPFVERRMWEFFDQSVIDRIYSGLDTSSNTSKFSNEKRATLYDVAPTAAFRASDEDRRLLDLGRLWALSQWRHLVTNVCNDSLVRVDWTLRDGISYRTVTPDCVVAKSYSPNTPDIPAAIDELRIRELPNGQQIWTWDVWDVSNPARPYFAVLSGDRRKDLTPVFMPELMAETAGGARIYSPDGTRAGWFPYVDRSGWPILPYALHHHRLKHRLWSWQERREIYDGTITAACLRTWFVSGLRDLVHPQRVGINVRLPAAVNQRGRTEVDRVTLDASSILMFETLGGGSGSLQTLEPAMDPQLALDSIERYNAQLLEGDGLGIEPSNTSRMSGYAIVVTRDSLRRVQRQQQPAATQGDRQILTIAARLLNAYAATDLPELPEEYAFGYHGIEFSLEEIRSRIEQVQALRTAKLMTRVDAMLTVYPSLTPEEARAKLAEIDAEDAAVAAAAATKTITMTDPSSGAPMRTPRGISQQPQIEQDEP